MEKNITCIICPKGCNVIVRQKDGSLYTTGNTCPKGEKYAISECENPVRVVTSSIRVSNRKDTMVSVKTVAPIPKSRIFEVMKLIRETSVTAPVSINEVIIPNVFGTVVVATKNII